MTAPRRRPPAIEVVPAQGGETFYRLLRGRRPEARDLYSARELGRRAPSRTLWVVFVGVSMFDSPEGALAVARRRPAIVAQVALPAGRGVSYARTAGQGHYTIWGAPEDLLAAVVDVMRHP